jgi:lipooligosaccharide transport system permease protein
MMIRTLRVVEGNARTYRRTWKGSAVTAFLNPVLFLLAMGLGFGALVDRSADRATLDGLDYISFLAPGLLAATAMQTGASEGMWPVMAGIKWIKTYMATLATPVQIVDLVSGTLLWTGIRVLMSSLAFVLVMAAFGSVPLLDGLAALLPALLVGLAFAAPITAYTASVRQETRLSTLFRFGIIPMFLFSGTFFPVDQLPGWLQPLAQVTPLWHGVELCRSIALGVASELPLFLHISYLALWIAAGWITALFTFRRRLEP